MKCPIYFSSLFFSLFLFCFCLGFSAGCGSFFLASLVRLFGVRGPGCLLLVLRGGLFGLSAPGGGVGLVSVCGWSRRLLALALVAVLLSLLVAGCLSRRLRFSPLGLAVPSPPGSLRPVLVIPAVSISPTSFKNPTK